MALVPNICAAFKTKCGKLVIKDITEEYNVDTNDTGWGTPNADISGVTVANVYISNPSLNATSDDPIDILVNMPASVTGQFTIYEVDITAEDGEWIITYELVIDDVLYTKTIKIFSSCIVRCCIDKMWANYASGSCDCGCNDNSNALQAEALYRAMMSSTACLNSATRNALLKKIQRLCELEECNCG